MTVVVAVKEFCNGCRDFVFSTPSGALGALSVLVISEYEFTSQEWRDAAADVVVSPSLWAALDIRSAPSYVVVDPVTARVMSEGVVFAPEQVAHEVDVFLSSR